MSEIKVGDLVQVVRLGCSCNKDVPGNRPGLGRVFVVQGLLNRGSDCAGCGSYVPGPNAYTGEKVTMYSGQVRSEVFALWRLKKIPPLSDLEGQKDSSGLDERHEFYEALRKMAEGLRS